MILSRFCLLGSGALWAASLLADFSPDPSQQLPSPAEHPVDFAKEIKPLLENSCVKCHGNGKKKGEFSIDTRESFLKGGESGPVVVLGKSSDSKLIHLVAALDPDEVMPKKGSKLKPAQVSLLRAWIDQGLSWENGFTFKKPRLVPLEPRTVPVPAIAGGVELPNPIDHFIARYFETNHLIWPRPVEDRIFARRVYMDLVGLLPPPERLERFCGDPSPDKRARLVDEVLSDSTNYAIHWLSFWNDVLRNDYKGTGYIDSGRKQITPWLFSALATNKPFDQFVAELINPSEDSAGFVKGIVWRGVVNASQRPEMQAAQNISQVFMGVNLKCASCHDSFINDWELADSYGLAGIYADQALEMFRCDKPTGKIAAMKFLYPELGAIDAKASKADRLKQLAQIITERKNGRLARTMVNRFWGKFFGRGLVEPVDDMDSPPWLPDLLDWLAADFQDHQYDPKRFMRLMATSRAYQLPSVPAAAPEGKDYVFKGPIVRRLSAEQFIDALSCLTGSWGKLPANTEINFAAGVAASAAPKAPLQPKWIWNNPQAAYHAEAGKVYFRKTIRLPAVPEQAAVFITCDNNFVLFVNGKQVGDGKEWNKPKVLDIREQLSVGDNLIAVLAENGPAENVRAANPAGLFVYGWLREGPGGKPDDGFDFVSDSSWHCQAEKVDGWEKSKDLPAGAAWMSAVELGGPSLAPWNFEKQFAQGLSVAAEDRKSRAALENADPLMVALGRPNREQVVTVRASMATTLQALELTNGRTLAKFLEDGAAQLIRQWQGSTRDLADRVFEAGLGRTPTPTELAEAESVLGKPAQKAGVEDLLWSVSLLPEFQLIY